MVLGAINSEYAKIASVNDPRAPARIRLRAGAGRGRGGNALLQRTPAPPGGYRFQWINVSNGSVYNNDQLGISSSAEHYIQMAGVRLTIPLYRSLGVGGDGVMFFRKSRYSLPQFADIDQRNPQARVYLTVNGVHQ
jgi:hypothetical protein